MVISSAKVLVVATMMVVLLLMLAGSESSSIRSACKKNKMPTDVQVNGSAFTGKWYLRASEDLPAALANLTSYGFRITPSENGTRLTIAGTMVFNEGERCNRTEYSCRFNDSVCTIDDGPNKGASFTVIAVDYDRVCAYFVRGKKYKSLRVMTRSPTADVDLSNLQCVTTFCGEEAADLDSEFYKYQFMYSSPAFRALCPARRRALQPC